MYRDFGALGGVLAKSVLDFLLEVTALNSGENSFENAVAMALKYRNFNEYHDDKRAKIEVRLYIFPL